MTKFFFIILSLLPIPSFASSKAVLIQIEKEIFSTQQKAADNFANLNLINEKIKILEFKIQQNKKTINQRIFAMAQLKKINWANPLVTANLSKADRNLNFFKKISQYEIDQIVELDLEVSELKYEQNQIHQINLSLKKLLKSLEEKEKQLLILEDEQKKNLILTDPQNFIFFKKTLSLPVGNPIIQKYGLQKSSKDQYDVLVKGLVFSGLPVGQVKAFGPGRVIFSDQIPYWGESLIIKHTGDYYSVYANVKNIKVAVNDKVESNQTLAETNTKDFYFELRHEDVAINPSNWIRLKIRIKHEDQ